jgi:hypothetical protein
MTKKAGSYFHVLHKSNTRAIGSSIGGPPLLMNPEGKSLIVSAAVFVSESKRELENFILFVF